MQRYAEGIVFAKKRYSRLLCVNLQLNTEWVSFELSVVRLSAHELKLSINVHVSSHQQVIPHLLKRPQIAPLEYHALRLECKTVVSPEIGVGTYLGFTVL